MLKDIKRLSNHVFIYGLGSIANNAASFLLIPIYTRYITPESYGRLEMLYVFRSIIGVFIGFRLAHSVLRFYYEYEDEKSKKEVFCTSFISLSMFLFFTFCVLTMSSSSISRIIFNDGHYYRLFNLIFFIMFFEILNEICLAFLRAKEYASFYIITSFSNLIIRLILCIYLVVGLKMDILGVLLGNLISIIAVSFLLFYKLFKYTGLAVNFSMLKPIIQYSYPLIIAAISLLVINSTDRLALQHYMGLGAVGIYAAGFKLAKVLDYAVIQPFNTGFSPFRFSIMNNKNAKEIYSRILTYYLFITVFLWLAMSIFSREIVQIAMGKQYWDAYKIIPIIVIYIIVWGIINIFQTPILIEKKTNIISRISIAVAICNVLFIIILTKRYGIIGAACALVLSNLINLFLTYSMAKKIFIFPIEVNRLCKIFLSLIVIFVLCKSIPSYDYYLYSVLAKTALLSTYPLLLFLAKFYDHKEMDFLKDKIYRLKLKLKIV